MKKSSPDTTNENTEPEILDETQPDVQSEPQPDSQPQAESTDAAQVTDTSAFEAKITELTNDLQRTRADFENYRKQTELQRSQAMSAARFATVEKFLPLVDDFSRAISTYPDQLAPLAKNFEKLLSGLGLSAIDSNPGTEFNPDFHEAVSVEDGEGETEVIIETLRPGYLYEGAVLRPAMVKVGRA